MYSSIFLFAFVFFIIFLFFFFFFFSSRRRHTRCGRDWSSDVCSSDLFLFLTPIPSPPPSFLLFLLRKQHYYKSIPRSLCNSVFLCKTVQKAIRFPRGVA